MAEDNESNVVLLIEDSLADQVLLKRGVEDCERPLEIHCASHGIAALEYLSHAHSNPRGHEWPYPDLILLDINMPRMDGLTFLQRVKADPRFESIPVVMLSTSSREADIEQSLELGAAAFFEKTADPNEMDSMLATLTHFLLGDGELPAEPVLTSWHY